MYCSIVVICIIVLISILASIPLIAFGKNFQCTQLAIHLIYDCIKTGQKMITFLLATLMAMYI